MGVKGDKTMGVSDVVEFHDTTLRDGSQSLWAMYMPYSVQDAILSELDESGIAGIDLNMLCGLFYKYGVRFLKEDPWKTNQLWKRKVKNTRKSGGAIGLALSSDEMVLPRAFTKLWIQTTQKSCSWEQSHQMVNTQDETTRLFPWLVPMLRDEGIELLPYIMYGDSPRHTDEFYANATREVMKFKPVVGITIEDASGLLTPERVRTLIPAIMREAKGVPLRLHCHSVSGNSERVYVEAMKLGVRRFVTCVPPLASGFSLPDIFNTIHNAHVLGLKTNINEASLRVVEERLTMFAKQENLPIGAPILYDHRIYAHKIPGGVISNTVAQLEQLHIADKLEEVLEEVAQIVVELGYPLMLTPHSQFIVSQAAINVATGERYSELLDYMIEFALGIWGEKESGLLNMDQNLKDRLLSQPNAKLLAKRWEERNELVETTTLKEMRAGYGMTNASDEEFVLAVVMGGTEEIKTMREAGPPKNYYTGKEPLGVLLSELNKHKDISRLHLQKGNSFFDFKRK